MKKIAPFIFLFTLFAFATQHNAQTPTPTPTPQKVQPADEEDVVRITTNLIQIDAVVVDKSGKVVTDLSPEDFEILENDKPQKITNFSFITVEPAPAVIAETPKKPVDKNAPPIPTKLRPEQIKRTIALVIDDLSLSFGSAYYTRRALKKFVDEMMQPGDLVAIVRTGSGVGALQSFTSDKQQLYAAIEHVKYNPVVGRTGAFAPIDSAVAGEAEQTQTETLEAFREDIFAVGTLGALNYIVRGMRELPGRKAVLLWSEGFTLISRTGDSMERNERVFVALQRLIDLANRSAVVIYTADPRGLVVTFPTAADNVGSQNIGSVISSRNNRLWDTQQGLVYLAQQTGGFAVRNTNDLEGGIRKVIDDQKSYYLIGYQPDAATFDPVKSRFNKLKVKVKRKGLSVRYRSGFFGIKDEDAKPVAVKKSPERQVGDALFSPFKSGDINLRLSSIVANDVKNGTYIRSLLHIPGKDLTLTKEADNTYKAVFNVVAVTLGDNGIVVDQIGQTYTLAIPDNLYERTLAHGIVYTINVPIKKAGAYQLRIALRDDKTEKIGSASQFIDVPDLKKDRIALSGIVLSSYDPKTQQNNSASDLKVEDGKVPEASPLTQAAMRRFRIGNVLQYGFIAYNAKLDKNTKLPQLTTQVKLFRDGQLIFEGKEIPVDANAQTDLKRLGHSGAIQLGTVLQPGEYILQVIVKDTLAKEKHRMTTRWIDFEVIK
jgi:VWFA-related protein